MPMAAQVVTCGASGSRQASSGAASSSGRAPATATWRRGDWVYFCKVPKASARPQAAALRVQAVAEAVTDGAAAAPQEQQQYSTNTAPTRRLSSKEAIEALYASQHAAQRATYCSYYSSELGGIVTDPALMVVQLDDHMVHRGHAVFDSALLVDGYLYQLDQHLQRFLTSAAKANIHLPPGLTPDQMKRTITETAAASCKMNGYVRYYLSAGRGGFGLSGNECLGATFYVVVYTQEVDPATEDAYLRGWRVKTSPVPPKAPYFARLKSTNYLPNALNLMDAQAEEYDQGIFVDAEGNVAEGPNMNLACLLADGTLVVPPFESSLAGITVQRVMELLPQAIQQGLDGVRRIEQRHISVSEAKAATEVFFIGSSLPIMPVVQWDQQLIADGTSGIVALQIRTMLQDDRKPQAASDQHVEVPYGYLTGMV